MDIFSHMTPRLTDTKKFYFLEYFYILLKSIEKFKNVNAVFEHFKTLKENLSLGESRYKKIGIAAEELTNKQLGRYKYTFKEVLEECAIYGLIESTVTNQFTLTTKGTKLLNTYEVKGSESFNEQVFKLIESESNGFYYFITSFYNINPNNGGMLIFPIYSPLKLHIQKNSLSKTGDIIQYTIKLVQKLEHDISIHLNIQYDLKSANEKLILRLRESNLIGNSDFEKIMMKDYNVIIKRIRDYWLNYFLREIYNIKVSLSYFDIWVYRAKQIGILNTTEFYPTFSGKIVYPVSIIFNGEASNDFKRIYKYFNDEKLYIHEPKWSTFQESFIQEIYNSYFDLKRSNRSYFINLPDLAEIVCYKLKLSYRTFTEFLGHAYQLNLKNKLRIKISLEADRLPFETKAMYLTRDPIIIEGKQRNIIAIDLINNE
ncbi:hypothetical protein [Mucilaginibacter sp. PAMB04168]|uniref:hypothetical protein n=1 Tax=Mucilaginibacter sp. PAMB04168 TaxID=3138567 RepID=UPI0031F65763